MTQESQSIAPSGPMSQQAESSEDGEAGDQPPSPILRQLITSDSNASLPFTFFLDLIQQVLIACLWNT